MERIFEVIEAFTLERTPLSRQCFYFVTARVLFQTRQDPSLSTHKSLTRLSCTLSVTFLWHHCGLTKTRMFSSDILSDVGNFAAQHLATEVVFTRSTPTKSCARSLTPFLQPKFTAGHLHSQMYCCRGVWITPLVRSLCHRMANLGPERCCYAFVSIGQRFSLTFAFFSTKT